MMKEFMEYDVKLGSSIIFHDWFRHSKVKKNWGYTERMVGR
jgi:hypothetical protein